MPSSRPNTIPTVIHVLRQLKPRSILDVGVGFGKWGHLFREYTDILEAERDPARYERRHWQVRIDGIEGFADYLTEMHRYLYNELHVGDARELLPTLGNYDLIFLGDIIEHLDKADGRRLLRLALERANKAVMVSTPKHETGQGALCANDLERHRSLWSARDFRKFEGATVRTIDGATLLAVIVKPGTAIPSCRPPRQPGRAAARRLRSAQEEIVRLIPVDEPFILVDEDQFRPNLPHQRALPFLEKDGQYWGPPPDDATAIAALERLRAAGAKRVVVTWPCFWWLEHYADFHAHLRATARCTVENEWVRVFDLERPSHADRAPERPPVAGAWSADVS
jgi:hypothetical protein